jgi:phosphate-selective porin OprO/OprP
MTVPRFHPSLRRLALVCLTGLGPIRLAAQTDSATAARLDSLEQALRVLARLRELDRDSAAAAQAGRASVSIGADGFQFRSADGAFRLRITGYIQADGRFYLHDTTKVGVDNLFLRRARPIIEGTLYRYFDFRIMPDFGQGTPTLYEAYLEARLSPGFTIRAGKFKPPIGLERLQSATDLRFAERGYPTNLAPNRDVGLQVAGELGHGVIQYAGGIFDGVADLGFGDNDVSDAKDFAARLFLVPFAARGQQAALDLGFGLAVGAGNERGTLAAPATSTLRSAGQLGVFKYRNSGLAAGTVIEDGRRTRIAPQGYLYRGAFGLLAEYTKSKHTIRLDQTTTVAPHTAWQIASSIVLTGERQSFAGVTPKRPFDPSKGQWGAVELAARYERTGVDRDLFPTFADPAASAREARTWSVGLNWHLARRIKLMVDYERTKFTGGGPNGGDRLPENFLVTRFQTAF